MSVFHLSCVRGIDRNVDGRIKQQTIIFEKKKSTFRKSESPSLFLQKMIHHNNSSASVVD